MTTRIWRGDAPLNDKQLRLVNPGFDAPLHLSIGNKTLEFNTFDASAIVAAWNASDFPEVAQITASTTPSLGTTQNLSDVLLTADEPGVLFDVLATSPAVITIETVKNGVAAVDQETRITIPASASGGTFTITCDFGSGDETTGAIAYNADAATVQTALEALATPAAGDVLVSGDAGGPYLIVFTQALSGTSVSVSASGAALTGVSSVEVSVVQDPSDQVKEIQGVRIEFSNFASGQASVTVSDGEGNSYEFTPELVADPTEEEFQEALDFLYGSEAATILYYADGITTTHGGSTTQAILIVEWADSSITRPLLQIDGEDPLNGGNIFSFTQRLQSPGAAQNHELWIVHHDYSEDTYTITHDGNTTAALAMDGTGDPETALEALASITDVVITDWAPNTGLIYAIEFADANQNEPDITITGQATAVKIKDGGPLLNTIQRLEVTAASGTFTLSDGVDTTDPIAFNASAATIKSELEADITAIDSVNVTGAFPVWLIEFAGSQAAAAVDALEGDPSSLVGGVDPAVAALVSAEPAINEIQRVTLSGNVGGGTFTLSHGSNTTAAIDYDESAAALEAIFDAAFGAGTTSVSGVPGGPYDVEFTGSLAGANQQPMTADASSLTVAGTGAQVEEVRRSRGPNHLDDPLNWTGDGPVQSGDTLIFERGDVSALWGLRWVVGFTANDDRDELTLSAKADLWDGQAVRVWTDGGTLPSNLSADTDYYIRSLSREQQTMQLSATPGGAAIDLGDNGSGDLYVGVALQAVIVYQRFAGEIGLPVFDASSFYEYRQRHWHFATIDVAGDEDNVIIGKGEGQGASLVRLQIAADHDVRMRVFGTGGSSEQDQPTVQLLADDAAGRLVCEGGSVGVAVLNLQESTLLSVESRADAQVHLGPNVAVTSLRATGGGVITSDGANSGAIAIA